jgi:hypothetical protein
MLILWIRKNKASEPVCPPQKEDKKSFQKHDEEMKKFRLAHPKIEATSPGDIVTKDGLILAPVHWVRLNKNIQN